MTGVSDERAENSSGNVSDNGSDNCSEHDSSDCSCHCSCHGSEHDSEHNHECDSEHAEHGSDFRDDLIAALKETGFSCGMCGECCRMNTTDSNLIIMSASEVREIMAATGLSWDEVAEPYPDLLEEDGVSYTFDWCIRRNSEGTRSCVFQGADNRCTIYEHRPWICRTYPLMLADSVSEDGCTVTNLLKSECLCYGNKITDDEAKAQAEDLIARKINEDREFMKIKSVYGKISLQKIKENGIKKCVIDSEGVKEIV